MDIRILRYFLAVGREENITRAAESLHIAQPSLSKQLMELEHELGRPLLVRGKRRVTLTEDGVLLRRRAEEIVALVDRTEAELTNGEETIRGEVALGGVPSALILRTAVALRTAHPEVRFRFFNGDATEVTERLDHGSLDFARLLQPVDTAKYDFLALPGEVSWGLLLPAAHPLAQKAGITRDDLPTVPLILHRRVGLQQEIARWARTEIENLNVAATYNIAYGQPADYVKSGLGAFLLVEDQLGPMDAEVCFRPLDPPLTVRHALVWKRQAMFSKAARAFLEEVKKDIAR